MSNFIMQMRPWFGKEEKKAICDYMDEDGFITEFQRTEKFEKMIASYTGAKHCVVVNNGTISLTLASIAVGIEANDEVIIPNYTMIATPNTIKLFGAKPIFVDVEAKTLCLDIELVKQAITKNTKAIMLVTANGRYPNSGIEAFESLCEEKGLILIEDAAQSLGSFYKDGRHIGNAGLVGSFSFSAPKIISTGQGGAIITNDDEVMNKIRRLKDFGRASGGNDVHDSIGYNFKFTELQACLGIEQMKKLQYRVERKKEIYNAYVENLVDVKQLNLFYNDTKYTAPWFIDCTAEKRDNLLDFLKQNGVGSRLMYPPINKQKAYSIPGYYPVSNLIGSSGLWLPSSSQLENRDIDKICGLIKDFYN